MNIQSNASGVSIETVAFMAAISSTPMTKDQIKFIDYVLDILKSPSLSSLQRIHELRKKLAISQSLVTFMNYATNVPLEPDLLSPEKDIEKLSSSISTMDPADAIEWDKLCKKLSKPFMSNDES